MLVCPSDHAIADAAAFQAAVRAGAAAAEAGALVTFGVRPTRPETGYGYLELQRRPPTWPPRRRRSRWRASSRSPTRRPPRRCWPAGGTCGTAASSCSRSAAIIARLRDPPAGDDGGGARGAGRGHRRPRLPAARPGGLGRGREPVDRLRGDGEGGQPCGGAPTSARGRTSAPGTPSPATWGPDAAGVATSGPATAIDCEDSLLRAESPEQVLVGHRAEERRRGRDARRGAGRRHDRRPAGQGGGGAAQVARRGAGRPTSRASTGPGAGTRRCRSGPASR